MTIARTGWIVAVCAAFLCTAVPTGSRAADPYEINAILSVTGQASFLGKEEAQALGVIEDMVNKAGGVAGRPVKFVVADDQSNPQIAVQLANVVIAKKAPVVIGPSLSGTCSATAPLLTSGPVELCLSPGIHPPEGSYVFSTNASTVDLAIITARYLRTRGVKKVAFIFSTDASGQDGEQAVNGVFSAPDNQGVTIVTREHFNVNDVSVAAQIAHIKASGAEVLYVWASGTPVATVLRGASDAGLSLPVITSVSNATYAQMKAYESFMPKELLFVSAPDLAPGELPNGRVKQAVGVFRNAFKAIGVQAEHGHALAWDAGLIVIDALRKFGTNVGAGQLREYLQNLRWQGISGAYDFRAIPQRGLNYSSLMVTRWDPAKGAWVGVSKLGG
ncbi:MAG TPA: ABC transporter substrate-binding protein [Candidatus Binatia bacterium]|nr:ABC transporter substrate-binding protein [Candidatus Binatia bacterium]